MKSREILGGADAGVFNEMYLVPDLKKDQITAAAEDEVHKLIDMVSYKEHYQPNLTKCGNVRKPRRPASNKVELHCDWCGKSIFTTEIKASASRRHYCSNDCRNQGHRRELLKEGE
jgi:hypothetical protein